MRTWLRVTLPCDWTAGVFVLFYAALEMIHWDIMLRRHLALWGGSIAIELYIIERRSCRTARSLIDPVLDESIRLRGSDNITSRYTAHVLGI